MLRALSLFKSRPRNVVLTVNAAAPDAVGQAVATRKAHVRLTIARSDLPGPAYRVVAHERASLYCGQLHDLFGPSEDELRDVDLESFDYVTRGYLVNTSPAIGLRRRSSATALHVEAAVQLILTGRYLGVLPNHIAEGWLQRGQLRKLPYEEYRTTMPVNIVLRATAHDTLAVEALVEDVTQAYVDYA